MAEKDAQRSRLRDWGRRAFASVDVASIAVFRVVFGGLLVWHVWRYFIHGVPKQLWLEPRFLFKFYGFSWVQPWPENWLYAHWIAMGVFAFFVAIGFCYRVAAPLLFLSFTYFFLLDEARYVNHTYLICLYSFLLSVMQAHRGYSVDAWLRPKLREPFVPAWNLWLLRLQMAVVYFFAGVAKFSPDWFKGEPMRFRFRSQTDFPLIGRWLTEEWAVYAASYGSLLLDLCVIPLLLWKRTRVPAFILAVVFHLMNARLFPIGVFPWLAIVATTLFFPPDWPRRVIGLVRHSQVVRPEAGEQLPGPLSRRLVLGFVVVYAAIQLLVPLRHFVTPGGIEWNYAEHRFSWRMMLLSQGARSFFYVIDPNTGRTTQVGLREFLNTRQRSMMCCLPDFPVQFAHYLARVMPRRGPQPLRVEARILSSINGRAPTLYLDPNVDLAAEPWPVCRPAWLRENRAPLPALEERYRGTGVSFDDNYKREGASGAGEP